MAKMIGNIHVSDFKGAIVGMILGDGHITNDDRDNGNASVELWGTDRDYMMFKKTILDNLTETIINDFPAQDRTIKGKLCHCKLKTRVRSKRHPIYKKLREHLYYQKKGTVDNFAMNLLTPLGLSIFYMDDGSYNIYNGAVHLYTTGYNKLENECIARGLAKNFNIQCSVYDNKNNNMLYVKKKSQDVFFNIIEPYIIDTMRYKLPNGERPLTRSKR